MKLYLKNMVCDRCRLVVENIVESMNWPVRDIRLGEVDLGDYEPTPESMTAFEQSILAVGFELISDRKTRLIDSIKLAVLEKVGSGVDDDRNLSEVITRRVHQDYDHLSHLFSSVEGMTIEHFYILQKIEKTKELLVYDELSLTAIADRLGYSSVSHLSRQFKQVTGLTPTAFRKLSDPSARTPLDKL